jgi:SAM-dependent methyltransferase
VAEADRDRWNARWRERGREDAALEPSTWVTSLDPVLPRAGPALDVAGGVGRHAIWLARRGLDVTLADVSDQGLALAARAAERAGCSIALLEIDLEREPVPAGPWEVVLCIHYLERSIVPAIAAALAPGGLFAFCHQTRRNLERHAHPGPAYLLHEGEATELVARAGLEVLSTSEGWGEEGRHEARVLARRASPDPTPLRAHALRAHP